MLKDQEIRQAIKAKIDEAISLLYAGENPAVNVNVYSRWVLAHRDGESAALLRVTSGRDSGKVHTWMIGSDSSTTSRADMHGKDPISFSMTGKGGLKDSGVNRRDILKSYKIWAYLEYSDGTGNGESDNSENALVEEVEYVANHLAKNPTLGITDSSFRGCMPLQIEEIDIINYSDVVANVAFCKLDVVLFKPIQ